MTKTAEPSEPVKRVARTIDLTPTWRGVVPLLLAGLENGTADGRRIAMEELHRMADAADAWNAHCKERGTANG